MQRGANADEREIGIFRCQNLVTLSVDTPNPATRRRRLLRETPLRNQDAQLAHQIGANQQVRGSGFRMRN